MKVKKRILTFVLLISLIINLIPLNVKASSETGDFELQTMQNNEGQNVSVIEYTGSTPLPETVSFFYVNQGYVHSVPIQNAATEIINRRLGTSFSGNWLTNFWSWATAGASAFVAPLYRLFGSSIMVWNNGSFCGIALTTDILGKPYGMNSGNDEPVTIPSDIVNIFYTVLNEYIETENPIVPDYVSLGCQTFNYAKEHIYDSSYGTKAFYENNIGTGFYNFLDLLPSGESRGYVKVEYQASSNMIFSLSEPVNFYCDDLNSYNTFCSSFGLTVDRNVVTYSDTMNHSSGYLSVFCRKKSDNSVFNYDLYKPQSNDGSGLVTTSSSSVSMPYPSNIGYRMPFSSNGGYITIFKDASVLLAMRNKEYTGQPINLGSDYNNYNTQGDNSINTTNTNINNAPTTNTNIYNQQTSTNQNYYYNVTTNTDNSQTYIDNSTVINNNQTIINNYYTDDDNGGGSGGDDDNNDSIWDKLLEALGGLFDKLGDIITVVATGIISIFTTILNLIVEISTNFTTITDTLSAFFSWIPTEIMTPIILGVNLMILIILLNAIKR